MAKNNFNASYQDYEDTLKDLSAKCADAEKNVIITETNLKKLEERKKELIEDCEQYAGTTIDKVPQIIEEKKQKLDEIMSKLGSINIDEEITDEMLSNIQEIIKEYNIS